MGTDGPGNGGGHEGVTRFCDKMKLDEVVDSLADKELTSDRVDWKKSPGTFDLPLRWTGTSDWSPNYHQGYQYGAQITVKY